jgi:hypothetical protein
MSSGSTRLDRLSTWLQVIGILAAGAWALFTLAFSAFPRLGPYFVGDMAISEPSWSAERQICEYTMQVNLTSKSIWPQKVDDVQYCAKWVDLPKSPAGSNIVLVDPDKCSLDTENISRGRKSPLVFKYSPEQSAEDGFNIFTRPNPGKALFIYVGIFQNDKEVEYYYDWMDSCTTSSPAQQIHPADARNRRG